MVFRRPGQRVIAVGGVVVVLLGGARFAAAAPYVDPFLVIIGSIGFAVIAVNLLRRAIRDLQTARPDSELVAQVETVVERSSAKYRQARNSRAQ
jgi:predicted Co/Zn/Cd cation transporter (cation efflux family)